MIKALGRLVGDNTDIALVLLVIGVLLVLFSPIPADLLDFLLLTNFSFALLILLLTFYMAKPVEFSTFPSLLLIATLFRLSLNIAATRLILAHADAGKVIAAIGSYVVEGNYVIGLIVFLILVVVQYVVVTNGAQRVSEVAARFTLDSMPGQQMSIDADLNMGFIDQDEAKRRRKNLEKEAAFYGAMDGASKFVKGDAIAGIIILLINIVGGLIIGITQMGMRWDQALQTFTLLTIGDGIVTQVPALVIAVGTGIIVTRSASDQHLSREVLRQITSFPKTLALVAAMLGVLLFLPGIPTLPGLILIGAVVVCALIVLRRQKTEAVRAEAGQSKEQAVEEQDAYEALKVEPIEVALGTALVGMVGGEQSLFMERVASFRKQYALESGLVLPRVRFRDGGQLNENSYEISIFGVRVARGEVLKDRLLAIHAAGQAKRLKGIETRDPTYGLPAVWIEESERDAARAARFTLVDAATVFFTHLSEVLRQHSAALLTRAETDKLLARVRQSQPGLVEEVIPAVLSVGDVQRVLQNLLREKVTVRNLEAILETLVDAGKVNKDPAHLTEIARQRLGSAICQSLVGESGALHVLTLDPVIEQTIAQSVRSVDSASSMVVEPKFAEKVIGTVAAQAERMMKSNLLPVLLCSPELRRHIRSLCERAMPHLRVLSLSEIPHSIDLKSFGTVSF
jgi:flagellar biosynthesis protein FlhA